MVRVNSLAAVSDSENLTVCVNKLKRIRQRTLSGQCIQPTALLSIRHFITQPAQCRRLGLFILESIVTDEDFCLLSIEERQSILALFEACKAYSVDQTAVLKAAVENANMVLIAIQPGRKRIWIRATRRKVNHHLLLAAEYCGYIFIRDWPATWGYEASIAYVFGYQNYRYITEQSTLSRLTRMIEYLVFDFNR